MTKIWFISDTHCNHSFLEIPDNIDIVCHCGDFSNNFSNHHKNLVESIDFFDWYSSLKIPRKILVPGNHDLAIEGFGKNYFERSYADIHILINRPIKIDGICFYGSPTVPSPPMIQKFPFSRKRGQMKQVWDLLPDHIDILLTHGPPKGILDITYAYEDRSKIVQVGCKSLLNKVQEISPSIHAFGHIHNEGSKIINFGTRTIDKTTFINCSCMINTKQNINSGIVIDYD